jgi:23S rRNA pseudouridine2457 synthase
MLIAFNKPFGVLSQFTPDGSRWKSLEEFNFPGQVYPIGRLDAESEGLLLLSDEAGLNPILLHPRQGHHRIYWVQVEGVPSASALRMIEQGVMVAGRPTLPCKAWRLDPPPALPPRQPPIRFRKIIPDSWIAMDLIEGKNRQVRRMTAAVGHPTLRLWRAQIGRFLLTDEIAPGSWRFLTPEERGSVLQH